jgi:hypothetical protein
LNALLYIKRSYKLRHSNLYSILAALVAQLAERVLGKDEVGGSNPLEGSISQPSN